MREQWRSASKPDLVSCASVGAVRTAALVLLMLADRRTGVHAQDIHGHDHPRARPRFAHRRSHSCHGDRRLRPVSHATTNE